MRPRKYIQKNAQKPKYPTARKPATAGPSMESMDSMLRKSGIRLNEDQLKQLWRYHNLLRLRNVGNELTRLIGFETIVIKHYVDCLIVGNFMRLPSPLVDVGTGPGFPGVPLKIRYPNIHMILAEPRPKRVAFLEEVIQEVGLKQTEVFEHRVVSSSFTTPVQGVITRAVETMDKTLLRTSGSLVPGGQAIFMKGPNTDDEIKEVHSRFGDEFELILDQAYSLPYTPHRRRLVVWRKTDAP